MTEPKPRRKRIANHEIRVADLVQLIRDKFDNENKFGKYFPRATLNKIKSDHRAKLSTINRLARLLGVGRERFSDAPPSIPETQVSWPGLGGTGTLLEAFERLLKSLEKSVTEITEPDDDSSVVEDRKKQPAQKLEYEHLREFWAAEESQGASIQNSLVAIRGSLSQYTPLLIARPKGVRKLHLAYRNNNKGSTNDLRNANMAVTAGQVAWRVGPVNDWYLLGLFESIVRNGIPVLVSKEYYDTKIKRYFDEFGGAAFEASVKGFVSEIRGFAGKFNVSEEWDGAGEVSQDDLGEYRPVLLVDGAEGSEIAPLPLNASRHLDGDIIVLLQEGPERYKLLTRFLDLSDPTEVLTATNELNAEIEQKYQGCEIVCRSDDLTRLFKKLPAHVGHKMTGKDDYSYPTTDELVDATLAKQDPNKTRLEIKLLEESLTVDWKVAIDVGCGIGQRFSVFDKHRGKILAKNRKLIAIDPDPKRLDQARTAGRQMQTVQVECIVSRASALLEQPGDRADVVTCIQVVGHVPNRDLGGTIDALHHVLRPNGRLILCVPVVGDQFQGKAGAADWKPDGDYFHAVDLTKPHSHPAFRRPLTINEFDDLAHRGGGSLLPVRCFYLENFSSTVYSELPQPVGAIPPTIRSLVGNRFIVEQKVLYSLHRLHDNDISACIGDLMLVLKKRG